MLSTFARSAFLLRSARRAVIECPVSFVKRPGECLESWLVAGHEDEVIAALCETVGIDGTDTCWRRL